VSDHPLEPVASLAHRVAPDRVDKDLPFYLLAFRRACNDAAEGCRLGDLLTRARELVQACSMCHNGRLDQSLSRARFRADLDGVSRAERDVAIARLRLPADNPLAMPPPRFRTLTAEARQQAIEALPQER
jgi:hypothetical protein